LAVGVACEALAGAGWSEGDLRDDATALVVGTSKGPVEDWLAGESCAADSFGLGQIAARVASSLRMGQGPRLTCSTACASGLHALIRAATMLQWGEARRALVVAVESSVHPLFLGGFNRLGVLPPPGGLCKPMDRDRHGFLVSEAAAAVCLNQVPLDQPPLTPPPGRHFVAIERYAMAGDATSMTGIDPTGVPVRRLLRMVLDGRPVDLIHAHATGTMLNDPIELAAIEASLAALPEPGPDSRPIIYSHKGALGHSLGASGLVAVVLNCLMHREGITLGNIHTHDPLPAPTVVISPLSQQRRISRSVVMASGFGGAAAAVSLKSADSHLHG
jgi:3-oxoacyl-[acyl-carrier-protein] synthase II